MLWSFLIQVLVLVLVWLFLYFIKRLNFIKINSKIKIVDVIPIFTIYYLHSLTVNSHGFSMVPYLIIVWLLLGGGLLLVEVFVLHRFKYGRFYLNFWRIGDLYFLAAWLIIGLYDSYYFL